MYSKCSPYGHQIYIAINTILYPYTLPIDHSSYFFSSLCLSCNLSQAKGHNSGLLVIITSSYHNSLYMTISNLF